MIIIEFLPNVTLCLLYQLIYCMWPKLLSIDCFISGPNKIFPSKPVCVDRLYRKKVLVNQTTITNVYTFVHNLHTLCCIPVSTAEPVYWTQAKWDNPHEPRWPITGLDLWERTQTDTHTDTQSRCRRPSALCAVGLENTLKNHLKNKYFQNILTEIA
jgi:hypothetical protein